MAFFGGRIPLIGVSTTALTQNAASTTLNVGLNRFLGTQVASQIGISSIPANLLQSQVTPLITGNLAQGVNQAIQQSLQSAGPLGPVLANIATPVTTSLGTQLTNLIANSGQQNQRPSKMFPGAGGEPEADYGGSRYNSGTNGPDVIFSIVPVSQQGPQASGVYDLINAPSIGLGDVSGFFKPENIASSQVNFAKAVEMDLYTPSLPIS